MLFNPPLSEGRPPVTAQPPTENMPQPVIQWPGWFWWRGVNGMFYARRPGTSPPWVVGPEKAYTGLLGRIREKQAGRR